MTTYSLTKRQQDALDFITDEIRSKGISPSYDEIMNALGLRSKSGVNRIVTALVERGHLVKLGAKARTLALSQESHNFTASEALIKAEKELSTALCGKPGWVHSVKRARDLIREARTQ